MQTTTHTVVTVTTVTMKACRLGDAVCFADHHAWVGAALGSSITAAVTVGVAAYAATARDREDWRLLNTAATHLVSTASASAQLFQQAYLVFYEPGAGARLAHRFRNEAEALTKMPLNQTPVLWPYRDQIANTLHDAVKTMEGAAEEKQVPDALTTLKTIAETLTAEAEAVQQLVDALGTRRGWRRFAFWLNKSP